MTATTNPKRLVKDGALYLGDNGRCFCGKHAGTSAAYTLRDISGQRIARVTPKVLAECKAVGFNPKCEECGWRVERTADAVPCAS